MAHSCVEIFIHLVFATRQRKALIPEEMEERLYSYFGGIAKKRQTPILAINGVEDHVHMLIKLHPSIDLSTLLKELKSYSSGWMKKMGYKEFGWQTGFGGFSYSKSMLPRLIDYIGNQKEHHKTHSFEDELAMMKKLWGVEWDYE